MNKVHLFYAIIVGFLAIGSCKSISNPELPSHNNSGVWYDNNSPIQDAPKFSEDYDNGLETEEEPQNVNTKCGRVSCDECAQMDCANQCSCSCRTRCQSLETCSNCKTSVGCKSARNCASPSKCGCPNQNGCRQKCPQRRRCGEEQRCQPNSDIPETVPTKIEEFPKLPEAEILAPTNDDNIEDRGTPNNIATSLNIAHYINTTNEIHIPVNANSTNVNSIHFTGGAIQMPAINITIGPNNPSPINHAIFSNRTSVPWNPVVPWKVPTPSNVSAPIPLPIAVPQPQRVVVPMRQVVPVPQPYPVMKVEKVAVPVPVPMPQPYPVERIQKVMVPHPVPVPQPYPMIKVEKVAVPHPVPVPQPYPVERIRKVLVPHPVPVPYPVVRTERVPQPVPVPYAMIPQTYTSQSYPQFQRVVSGTNCQPTTWNGVTYSSCGNIQDRGNLMGSQQRFLNDGFMKQTMCSKMPWMPCSNGMPSNGVQDCRNCLYCNGQYSPEICIHSPLCSAQCRQIIMSSPSYNR